MASRQLKKLANRYWGLRRAQEMDHSSPGLSAMREEAHDALMLQMGMEGVKYAGREDAAQWALKLIRGEVE